MKLIMIFSLLVLSSCATTSKSVLKVGDCVRELGYNAIETVTAIADYGAVETRHTNKYYNSEVPKSRTEVYNKVQQEKLIKVNCN